MKMPIVVYIKLAVIVAVVFALLDGQGSDTEADEALDSDCDHVWSDSGLPLSIHQVRIFPTLFFPGLSIRLNLEYK